MSREIGFDEGPLWDAVHELVSTGSLMGHVTTVAHSSLVGNGRTVYVISMPTGLYKTLSTGERLLWDVLASVHGGLPVYLSKLNDHIAGSDDARLVAAVILAGLKVSTRETEGVTE